MSKELKEPQFSESLSLEQYFSYLDDWMSDSTNSKGVFRFLSPVLQFHTEKVLSSFLQQLVGDSADQGEEFYLYKDIFSIICPALYEAKHKKGLWRSIRDGVRNEALGTLALEYIRCFVPDFKGQINEDVIVNFIDRLYEYLMDLYKRVYGDQEHRLLIQKCQSTENAKQFLTNGMVEGVVGVFKVYFGSILDAEFSELPETLSRNERWIESNSILSLLSFVKNPREKKHLETYIHSVISILCDVKEQSSLEMIGSDDVHSLYHVVAKLQFGTCFKEGHGQSLDEIVRVVMLFKDVIEQEFIHYGKLFTEGVEYFFGLAKDRFLEESLPLESALEGQLEGAIRSRMQLFWSQIYGVTLHLLSALEELQSEEDLEENDSDSELLSEIMLSALGCIKNDEKLIRDIKFLIAQNQHIVSCTSPSPLKREKKSPPITKRIPRKPRPKLGQLKSGMSRSLVSIFSQLKPSERKQWHEQWPRPTEFVVLKDQSSLEEISTDPEDETETNSAELSSGSGSITPVELKFE